MRIPQPARDLPAGETTVNEKPLDVPELLKATSASGVSSQGSVRLVVPSVQVSAPPAVLVLMPTMAVTHTNPYGMGMRGMMQSGPGLPRETLEPSGMTATREAQRILGGGDSGIPLLERGQPFFDKNDRGDRRLS